MSDQLIKQITAKLEGPARGAPPLDPSAHSLLTFALQRIKQQEKELRLSRTQAVQGRASALKAHDDANPDIGWGMAWGTCVKDAQTALGYKDEQLDMESLK